MSAKRVRKTVVKAAPARQKKIEPVFEPDFSALSYSRGEEAWLSLNRPALEDDPWSRVEEHLLGHEQDRAHSFRRWKHFSR